MVAMVAMVVAQPEVLVVLVEEQLLILIPMHKEKLSPLGQEVGEVAQELLSEPLPLHPEVAAASLEETGQVVEQVDIVTSLR